MKRNKVISYLSKLSPKELRVLNEEAKHEKRQARTKNQKDIVDVFGKIERCNARNVIPLDGDDIHDLCDKIHELDKDYSITFQFERKQCLLAEYFIIKYKGKEIYKTKENSIRESASALGFLTGLYEQLKQSK